jgi:aminoglycoside phosphotransferase family enzyme/predicted kinase
MIEMNADRRRMSGSDSNALIDALRDPARYPHPVERVAVIETHISWVLLTGRFAYKIKKPVDLGFLDFTTLERRKHYCEEELRLNRRLAPELYLDVAPITGSAGDPRLGGEGEPFEFALRMVEFPQEERLDRALERAALTPAHIDSLAAEVARFHKSAEVASTAAEWGRPELVRRPVDECLALARERLVQPAERAQLEELRQWMQERHAALEPKFEARKREGFVREGHGDLHLANMAFVAGRIALFDCLEFSEPLRWIDVMCDLAFAVMDLADRGRQDLSHRLLGAYVEATGDFAGLAVLPYSLVYRALVRAEVAAIRAGQPGIAAPEKREAIDRAKGYLALAAGYSKPSQPALIITHGVSGSGKSIHAQALLENLGAIRIRSDVERKRLFGFAPDARTPPDRVAEVYGPAANQATYERLAALARTVVMAGWPVIIDATFLKREHRAVFRRLADELGIPFVILDFRTGEGVLRERVAARSAAGHDPSEATLAVLAQQLGEIEPPGPDERPCTVLIDTEHPPMAEELLKAVRRVLPAGGGLAAVL